MLIGVAIVITVYLLMNVSFFAVLSYDQIKSAEAVALVRLIHKKNLEVDLTQAGSPQLQDLGQ